MKKFSIVMFLILPILTTCSSAVKKDPSFYSDSKSFFIPLYLNKDLLCVDPTDSSIGYSRIEHTPLPANIFNSLSDFGLVIGEMGVLYSDSKYNDLIVPYYIVKVESYENLFIEKNRANVSDKNEDTKLFHITGESDGIVIDINMNNAQIIDKGKSMIMIVKLKNTSKIVKKYDTSTDKISIALKDEKSGKEIKKHLNFYNYGLKRSIEYINDINPGEERKYYAKVFFKDENESIGFQMTLMFLKTHINGLSTVSASTSKKEISKIKNLFGGYFLRGDKNETVSLEARILQ